MCPTRRRMCLIRHNRAGMDAEASATIELNRTTQRFPSYYPLQPTVLAEL
jgi:hypothetical protein